ncbi:MAG: hypothetical protein DRN07_05975 [Thermoplasmata archaeon]|nr:MAG: hypothetical protein DRN07_05975 [Thermoplasmata archaeon]
MKIVKDYFNCSSKVLKALYECSGELKHSSLEGMLREGFISNFLERFFPKKFIVGTGEIIDSDDNISRQADIIIYDESFPIFDYGGASHFLSSGVLAHIEVKSRLRKTELLGKDGKSGVLGVIDSVKDLNRDIPIHLIYNNKPDDDCNQYITDQDHIPCYIFAYKGLKMNKLKDHIENHYKNIELSKQVDGICVLDEYTILKNNVSESLEYHSSKDDALLDFFLSLHCNICHSFFRLPDLFKYVNPK